MVTLFPRLDTIHSRGAKIREEEEKEPNLQGWRRGIFQGVGGRETAINLVQGCDDPFGEWIADCVRATQFERAE